MITSLRLFAHKKGELFYFIENYNTSRFLFCKKKKFHTSISAPHPSWTLDWGPGSSYGPGSRENSLKYVVCCVFLTNVSQHKIPILQNFVKNYFNLPKVLLIEKLLRPINTRHYVYVILFLSFKFIYGLSELNIF